MASKAKCPLSTRDIASRIILFAEQVMEVKYYTYQSLFMSRILEAVIDREGVTITGLWARQSGKTEAVAGCGIGLAVLLPALSKAFPGDERFMGYVHGFRIGVYAPKEEQAMLPYERMRSRVTSQSGEAVLSDQELGVKVNVNRKDRLVLSNGSIILCKTASAASSAEGATHDLLFLEEAQDIVRSKVDKELRPMLASTNGSIINIGTASDDRGSFFEEIKRNQEEHAHGGKRNHFEFPFDIIVDEKERAYQADGNVFHLNYQKFVERELRRLGGDIENDEFAMNFRCKWRDSRVKAINDSLFYAAAIRDLEAGPHQMGFQVAGLDIGKVQDRSVLTVIEVDMENLVVNEDALPGADEDKQVYYRKVIFDWMELAGSFEGNTGQYKQLVERLYQLNVKILVVDASSIGDPVYERISAMVGDNINVIPFKFSSVSKSNLCKYYMQELHARRVFYAAGDCTRQTTEFRRFIQEHKDLDLVNTGGYTVCQATEGNHDDYPMSAALAVWAEKMMSKTLLPDIEVSSASVGFTGGRASYSGRGQQESDMDEVSVTTNNGSSARNRYAKRW